MNDVKNCKQHSGSSLCAGTMLRGRYRIEKTLGQGGFGITYSALDTKLYQRVAVKELFPSRCVIRSDDHQTIELYPGQESNFHHLQESFEKEARILIKLQNQEGVVRLMHVFSENNTMYYVMELLEGEDLMHWLKRKGAMSWEQLAPILKTILQALEQIHAVGLIHRDISPDNIFLTEQGARLIDFGSVRNYQGDTTLTALVKRNFAPLEQFIPTGHQGRRTDIYALAVTAYFALSGQLPPSAIERRFEDNLIPLNMLCPELPIEICAAIHHSMMMSPEKRFQTTQQFRNALKLDETHQPTTSRRNKLVCLRGAFCGKSWRMQRGDVIRIGRNVDCDIPYPQGYPGVSRIQCEVFLTKDGRFCVRDHDSRYGTWIKSAEKKVALQPRTWYAADGAHIIFGAQEEYVFMR